ncbi:hypothetical protein SSX86_007576 [Deinandra increscens subsp. villosa]|uniref:Uncharacterized protein n=1 Tax=Deinandra increscens subsp. villosa TaxID=3103831 RepID=A0AAP0DIB5_9ASTR
MGEVILLFSTMTTLLDVMDDYLYWKQHKYLHIDGHTSDGDRESILLIPRGGWKYCRFISVKISCQNQLIFLFLLNLAGQTIVQGAQMGLCLSTQLKTLLT